VPGFGQCFFSLSLLIWVWVVGCISALRRDTDLRNSRV
jgi:hypothetical protein